MKCENSLKSRAILEIDNLSIGYDKKPLFENLSFNTSEGQILFVMGSNGSGKSTLLKTLSNLTPPLSGSISLKGKETRDYSSIDFAKKVSVLLTDKPNLNVMNVKEVISLGRFPHTSFWGSLNTKDKKIIDETIELLKLQHLTKKNYNTLSDGQKQKVLLGRTLVQNSPLIILDEPTSFLDVPRKNEFSEILKFLVEKQNKTIILSSHDWDFALKNAHSLLFLGADGHYKKGLPEDFYFNQDFRDFLEKENFKIPEEASNQSDFQIGSLSIRLNFENHFEKKLTIKAIEKRASLVDSVDKSFIISKKENDDFYIKENNGPQIKVQGLSDLLDHF